MGHVLESGPEQDLQEGLGQVAPLVLEHVLGLVPQGPGHAPGLKHQVLEHDPGLVHQGPGLE